MKFIFLMKPWELERRSGKNRFILIRGVVIWGGLTATMAIIFNLITNPLNLTLCRLIRYYIIWQIGGYFYGLWLWNFMERKYTNEINKKMTQTKKQGND